MSFRRYTRYAKKEILDLYDTGKLSIGDLIKNHALSVEEIDQWRKDFRLYGFNGLESRKLPQRRITCLV